MEALKLAAANGWDFLKNLHYPMLLRAEFLAYTIKPDGSYVWTGDSTRGSAFDYVEIIADSENRPDLKYIASFGERGAPPPRKSSWYAYGGVGVMRSDWGREANYLFFDVGPVGVLHGHEGKLAVEVVAYGRSLVEDLGIHTYATTERDMPFHDFFTASAGHNTVIVDGKSQVRLKTGPFTIDQPLPNRWYSTATCDFLSGSYSEGYGAAASDEIDRSVVHRRSVIFVKGRKKGDPEYWIITDNLTGDGIHTCEQLFHLIPVEVSVDRDTKTVQTATPDQPNLAFVPVFTDGLELEVVEGRTEPSLQGWYCGGGPRPTPAPCVTYCRTGML
ncbi:MAG: heparinase II/III-family protein, partial [Proteobacteria bacterium]|nr:heparinase II/III-family protein [Pseudomonadota bacterium]